jgi:hypothetical protein
MVQKGYKGMTHTDTLRVVPDIIKLLNGLATDPRYIARAKAARANVSSEEL